MPDQRSVMKEYRSLDAKRVAQGLSPEEEARFARLRDLVGPEMGAGGLGGGFDVNAAAERLRASLLPAGLRGGAPPASRPVGPPVAAPAEASLPELTLEAADGLASDAVEPFTLGGADGAGDPLFDPATLGLDVPTEGSVAVDAQQTYGYGATYVPALGIDPGAPGDTMETAPWDPSGAWDPNAASADANAAPQGPGTEPWDPQAGAYDPAAATYDPAAAALDPDAALVDPAAATWDPDASFDPNATAQDPDAAAYDPNAAAWDPNALLDPSAAAYDPNAAFDPDATASDASAPVHPQDDDLAPLDLTAEALELAPAEEGLTAAVDGAFDPAAALDPPSDVVGLDPAVEATSADGTPEPTGMWDPAAFAAEPADAAAPETTGAWDHAAFAAEPADTAAAGTAGAWDSAAFAAEPQGAAAPETTGAWDPAALAAEPANAALESAVAWDAAPTHEAEAAAPETTGGWSLDAALDASLGAAAEADPTSGAAEPTAMFDLDGPAPAAADGPTDASPLPPDGWDVSVDPPEAPAAFTLGEYDEAASAPPIDLEAEPTLEEPLADAAAAPEGLPAPALGAYDDTEGFGFPAPAEPPASLAAPEEPAPAAEWQTDAALDQGFAQESSGSFDASTPEASTSAPESTESWELPAEGPGASEPAIVASDPFPATEVAIVERIPTVEGAEILEELALDDEAQPASLDFGSEDGLAPAQAVLAPPPPPPPAVAAPAVAPRSVAPPVVAPRTAAPPAAPPPAVARAVAPPKASAPPAEAPAKPASRLAGTHRVVVHTVDGQVKRGVLEDADLAAAVLGVAAQPGGAQDVVPADRVKAIFFMLAAGETAPAPAGKKVRVTFRDGRQVAGYCPDYREDGAGFFMIPADTRTNTGRIWVYRAAVKGVAVT
jgi:hypothetical protein